MTDDRGQITDDRPLPSVLCLLSSVLCLLSSVFCLSAREQPTVKPGQYITIFFTGNELGAMKPCGCSGGQLGGLDRRYAVLSGVPRENRLVLDTGSLVPDAAEQNVIKFNVIVEAFSRLGYDVLNLTEQDIVIARQAGMLEGLPMLVDCITAAPGDDLSVPAKVTKRFLLNGSPLEVTVAAIDGDEQLSRLNELFTVADADTTVQVNILILNKADSALVDAVSKMRLADCILAPPQSDEPMLVSRSNVTPMVIVQGRLGKYVGKIEISSDDRSARPRLSFSLIPVTQDLAPNQSLVELYKDYQQLVRQANLLEKHPRFFLPNGLEYVGSKSCKLCHDYEYEKWMTSPPLILPGVAPAKNRHASAFATLEEVGSDYDPECVVCHVVGMQYKSGFISPDKTPELKDVGCENCHGPGSEHIRSLGAVLTSGPMSTCTDCHTAEQSGDYAANEKQYFEKTIHWRQPVSAVKVRQRPRMPPEE